MPSPGVFSPYQVFSIFSISSGSTSSDAVPSISRHLCDFDYMSWANSFYADGGIPPQQGQLLYRQHSSAMVVDIPVVLTGGPIIMPASSAIHNNNYTISYVFLSFLPPVRRCCLRKCSGEWLSDKPFQITRYAMIT